MRLSTILKVVGILVVAVIVGGVIVIMNTDFNQYKGLIAEKVKEATGRNLSIAGDIELELSFTPSLSVSGVRFENAKWGSKPDMLSVEKFSAQVALLPLLSNTIEVDHVLLQGAEILIEREADGRANFVFEAAPKESAPPKDETPASSASSSAAPADKGPLPIPIVRKVLIENAKLTYRDVGAGVTETVVLKKISLDGEGPQAPVNLTFDMTLNGQSVSGGGQLGPLDGLTDPEKDWPLKLTVEAGGAKVGLDGTIRDPAGVKGFNLGLTVSGESLATLSALAGSPVPPIGPYQVSASVRGDPLQVIQLADIAVKVGKSDIGGDLKVDLSGKKPNVDGKFSSQLIDLSDFTKVSSAAPQKSAGDSTPAQTSNKPAASDGRILPNDPLPLDAMKLANAKISLTAKRVLAQGIAVENIATSVALKDGDLQVAPLKAEVSKGTIDGKVRLNAAAKTPALDVGVKASQIDLGKLLTDAAITDLLEGGLNAQVQLKGRGNTVRALAAGMDGQVKVVMGEGRVKTTALDTFIGGPTGVITKLVTGDQKEFTVLNCVISQTDIKKGLATLTAAAVDTEFARITGKGNVNLRDESIAVTVNPEPKSATLNLAVAVKVGGTLANPSYGLDELSVLKKLGGAVLGIGFPPALILGMGELGADGDNPCLKPTAGKGEASAPSKSDPASSVTKGVEDTVKGVTEGAGKLLKGLFGN